ncbi:MAG: hypothetical protein ABN502_18255 [Gammaproteobacteria bacterium]|jgi:hypothetical protein|nr:hypothetical protein [Pseudomonas sp. Hp2]
MSPPIDRLANSPDAVIFHHAPAAAPAWPMPAPHAPSLSDPVQLQRHD